jgi:molybdopterin molybdotransferase
MLSFEEAQRRLLAGSTRLPAERVGIDDACGRVLAEAVVAPCDAPAFDYSAMDGYAVNATAWPESGLVHLPVHGESRAGSTPFPLVLGSACRIFTGAPVPEGANAIVMQEHVERAGDTATFTLRPKDGEYIRRRGEDLVHGAIALAPGTRLRPSHIALAAACDRAWLAVARRPTVSILGTGDEPREAGTIPDSNSVALRAMALGAGANARVFHPARDDRDTMTRAFEGALRGSDLLVTIGGVSVGDHDLVRPVLEALGAEIDFWKVAIKPGKPLLVGRRGDTIILGLPGNPASAMVTFALFGVPLLRTLQGDSRPLATPMRARASQGIPHSPGRFEFVRVTVARDGGEWLFTPVANQASGATVSMARADGLACVAAERRDVLAGESVDVLWLDELGA